MILLPPLGIMLAELALVLIVNTTAAELLPGVTELGVNVHGDGAPEHDKLTAFVNDAPTGSTLKL
jgi:hypothetical protein